MLVLKLILYYFFFSRSSCVKHNFFLFEVFHAFRDLKYIYVLKRFVIPMHCLMIFVVETEFYVMLYSTTECYVVQYNRMLCCTGQQNVMFVRYNRMLCCTGQQNVEKLKQKSSGWKDRMKIPHYKVQKSRLLYKITA